MAVATGGPGSRFARYAWTVFVASSALFILFGVIDQLGYTTDLERENALNELLIGLFGATIAVFGLRRGERWAWYATVLWPLYVIAQGGRAWTAGKTGEAMTGLVLLVLMLAALAVSYRRSFLRS